MRRIGRFKKEREGFLTVPDIRLNKKEEDMFAIKAAMFAGGSLTKLIRDAVASYSKELMDNCFYCEKEMEYKIKTKKYTFTIGDKTKVINVSNVPIFYCSNCKTFEGDVILDAEIEEIFEERIGQGNFEDFDLEEMMDTHC